MYHIENSGKDVSMDYGRITEDEYNKLFDVCRAKSKEFFGYKLIQLGIAARWKSEADEFIKFIEERTGQKWENPYQEKPNYGLITDDEKMLCIERINIGYYEQESIDKRFVEEERKKLFDKINKLHKEHRKKIESINKEYEIKIYMATHGIPDMTYIYYSHLDEVAFNWCSEKITKEQFDEFMLLTDKPEVKAYKFRETRNPLA